MTRQSRPTWFVLALILVAVLLLIVMATAIAAWGTSEADDLLLDVRRYLIQFLLVVALGAVLAFLVEYMKKRAESREQERRYRTETLTTLLGRLDAIYRHVKHIRQRLDIDPGYHEDNVAYMWQLREGQEDLEQLGKDLLVHKNTFRELETARKRVEEMDTYLGECWREYRVQSRSSGSKTEYGERMRKFIESPKTGESDFPVFSVAYHAARSVIVDLLTPIGTLQTSRLENG